MNSRLHTIFGFMILLSGLPVPVALSAQEIVIESANPSEAEQGTILDVVINGDGFDKTVKEVKFLVHCEQPCADDTGGVVVNSFQVNSSKKITANVNVAAQAKLSSYDIAVATRGRGGKGTTYREENLFTVKLRPNQQLLSCGDVTLNHQGTCTCQFVWNGDDAFLPTLIDDCVTSETLFLKHRIRGEGDGPGSQFSITAVPCSAMNGQSCCIPSGEQTCTEADGVPEGTFRGSSVIANTTHRAAIRWLDIRFDGVPLGCGNGIEAAVSFILDDNLPDPRDPDPLNRNSLFNVNNIGIFSTVPLCNAIEIVRTDGYSAEYTYTVENGSVTGLEQEPARDWKVYATDNLIEAGSYEQAGIVMLGIMPSESINPPSVFGNTIGAGACSGSNPVGILYGDLAWDPENRIEGVVENNAIDMNGIGDSEMECVSQTDTGILVAGDPDDDQTTVKVSKNIITDAYLGIHADCDVAEVNFSGNNLSGDNTWPTGILSQAEFTETQGKPNKFSGYQKDFDDVTTGCPTQPE